MLATARRRTLWAAYEVTVGDRHYTLRETSPLVLGQVGAPIQAQRSADAEGERIQLAVEMKSKDSGPPRGLTARLRRPD